MINRRQWLRAGALLAGAPVATAAPTPATNLAPVRLLQPLDTVADQQEQVRDHAAGLQLACFVRAHSAHSAHSLNRDVVSVADADLGC